MLLGHISNVEESNQLIIGGREHYSIVAPIGVENETSFILLGNLKPFDDFLVL